MVKAFTAILLGSLLTSSTSLANCFAELQAGLDDFSTADGRFDAWNETNDDAYRESACRYFKRARRHAERAQLVCEGSLYDGALDLEDNVNDLWPMIGCDDFIR